MSDHVGRIFGILAALAVLWIVVYWWWEPSQPRITFDNGPNVEQVNAPGPREPVPEAGQHEPLPAPPTVRPQPPQRPAVAAPRFRDYTLKKGDSVESIAKAELGSSKYASAIREANPLTDLDHIKAGRVIRVPLDPSNIQGKPIAPPQPETAPATPPSAAEEYTVKPGDTLSEIAKAKYGSVKFKDFLYQNNKDRVKSEDDLRAGDKLRILPKPK